MKIINIFLLFLGTVFTAKAQIVEKYFSIKDAINYGIVNHPNVQKTDLDLKKYNFQFQEVYAAYLPQINADASYTYNLKLASQIIPGEVLGRPGEDIAVQFGTKFNAAANIDVSQTLFDKTQLTAQKIVKESMQIGVLNKQKSIEQTIYDIANAYTVSQITFLQQVNIQDIIQKTDSLIVIIKSSLENGFALPIDLRRVELNRSALVIQQQNAKIEYEQSLLLLKYAMAHPLEVSISIDKNINTDFLQNIGKENEQINSIQNQLLTTQKHLTDLSVLQLKHAYLPKISINFRYGTLAQNNIANIFGSSAFWAPNSLIRTNVNIPIFDGKYKSSKIAQLKITQQQQELDLKILENAEKLQLKNTETKQSSNISKLRNIEENIALANDVYALTRVQFHNGRATLTELLDADTDIKTAKTDYLKVLAQVQLTELERLKITGNIQLIIK